MLIILAAELEPMAASTDFSRVLLILVALVLLAPLLMMAFAWPMMGMWAGGPMWDGGMGDAPGATWMWISMWLALSLLLLVVGYALYRTIGRQRGEETDPALEELRLAYARGDLSDEEFEERRERLERET